MIKRKDRNVNRQRRHLRIRRTVAGTPERPRLSVFRSLAHVYAQLVDDGTGRTLAAASTLDPEIRAQADAASKSEAWTKEYRGRSAKTPREAAEGQDLVFSCVGNDADLRADLGVERRGGGERPPRVIVDELRVHVGEAAEHRQPRPLGRAGHRPANPKVPPLPTYVAILVLTHRCTPTVGVSRTPRRSMFC